MSQHDLLLELERIEKEALDAIRNAASPEALEQARVQWLGRKEGRLTAVLRRLGELDAEERPRVGAAANRVKAAITELLEARAAELSTAREVVKEDLTLPARAAWVGARHPVTQVIDDVCAVLGSLGFVRVRGPEAETDWYNFIALNTPLDHPAADMHDPFYPGDGILLRSHTSPVQIRTMQAYRPPIRIVAPGMCYRRDPFDPSHAPAFEQIEGLVVDEGISFVDLRATVAEFARWMFGPETKVRF